jgi:hypothetical protein
VEILLFAVGDGENCTANAIPVENKLIDGDDDEN